MKTYIIPQYGIEVVVTDKGTGSITSDLKKHLIGGITVEEDKELFYSASGAISAIESLILGHAVAGLDIHSPAYVIGLESCLEALGNNL